MILLAGTTRTRADVQEATRANAGGAGARELVEGTANRRKLTANEEANGKKRSRCTILS
jgi:hypothetical protein